MESVSIEIFRQLKVLAIAEFFTTHNNLFDEKYYRKIIKNYILPLSHTCSAARTSLRLLSDIESKSNGFKIFNEEISISENNTRIFIILFNVNIFLNMHLFPKLGHYRFNLMIIKNEDGIAANINRSHSILFNTLNKHNKHIFTAKINSKNNSINKILLPYLIFSSERFIINFIKNEIYWKNLELFYDIFEEDKLSNNLNKKYLKDSIKKFFNYHFSQNYVLFGDEFNDKNIKKSIEIFFCGVSAADLS